MKKKKLLSLLLTLVVIISMIPINSSAATVPSLDAPVTKENVLALLNAYDREGAFMVKYGTEYGTSWLGYYSENQKLMDGLDTVVHEECHDFSRVSGNAERMYLGRNNYVTIPFTDIFLSKEMVKSVPKRCQTSRFSTYISHPSENLASNVDGIYGLINEFVAYGWGMHNNISMYPYHDNFNDDMNTWGSFIMNGASNRLAYAEFKYYILHYLYYAKKHHPDIYRQLISNKELRTVYRKSEKQFANLIKSYENDLSQISDKIGNNGYKVYYTADYFIVRDKSGSVSGMGLLNDEYSVLITELKKAPYQVLHKALSK